MERHLIYIAGLRDPKPGENRLSRRVMESWEPLGYRGHEVNMHWEDDAAFSEKLSRVMGAIDALAAENRKIFLLGVSAGASTVLNAYAGRRNSVAGVAAIAGWLRATHNVESTLDTTRYTSKAFVESVRILEQRTLPSLSKGDKSKIITVRPLTDERVPPDIGWLDEVKDIQLPVWGHRNACVLLPTHHAGKIAEFFASK